MAVDRTRARRILCVVVFYGLLVLAGQVAGDWVLARLGMEVRPGTQAAVHQMVLAATALYVLLLALPFMPGVEIGLGLMVLLGPSISFLVYLSTVIALVLAFTVGRLVPPAAIIAIFGWLRLARAADVVARIAPLPADERLEFLLSRVPARFVSFLLRHRYVALAVVLNLPGNALIGGGGGIALACGVSRIFSVPGFLLTVALAVSPVPVAYYLAGGFR